MEKSFVFFLSFYTKVVAQLNNLNMDKMVKLIYKIGMHVSAVVVHLLMKNELFILLIRFVCSMNEWFLAVLETISYRLMG